MELTTQWIIGILVAFVLVGVLIAIYVKIFVPSGGTDNNGCQPGTTYQTGYGCVSCDPTTPACQTCTTDGKSPCQNGGTCSPLQAGGITGYCSCPAPFFGPNCEKNCTQNSDCPNGGTCGSNGTCGGGGAIGCNAKNCIPPPNGHCELTTCKCDDGWTTDPNDPNGAQCTICADGRGPPGDCSRKLFDSRVPGSKLTPLVLGTQDCLENSAPNTAKLQACQANFGNSSTIFGSGGWESSCHGDDGCSGAKNSILCNVPVYWADPIFDPSEIVSCPADAGNRNPPNQNVKSYWNWATLGGLLHN